MDKEKSLQEQEMEARKEESNSPTEVQEEGAENKKPAWFRKLSYEWGRITYAQNLKFTLKTVGSFVVYVFSNFKLMNIGSFSIAQYVFGAISLVCFSFFVWQIYKRYRYYSSIVHDLESCKKPSYLIISYFLWRKRGRTEQYQNHFNIEKVTINYNISASQTNSAYGKLEIIYTFEGIATRDTSEIYFFTLSQLKNIESPKMSDYIPKHKILRQSEKIYTNLDYAPMDYVNISGIGDSRLQMWKMNSIGEPIRKNHNFEWEIKIAYKDPYQFTHRNRFVIDPLNYCNGEIGEIAINVNITGFGHKTLKGAPKLIHTVNGLDDQSSTTVNLILEETNQTSPKGSGYCETYHGQASKIDSISTDSLFLLLIPSRDTKKAEGE